MAAVPNNLSSTSFCRISPINRFLEGPINNWLFQAKGRNYLPLRQWRVNNKVRKYRRIPKTFDPSDKNRIASGFEIAELPDDIFAYIEKERFSNCRINNIPITGKYKKASPEAPDVIYDVYDVSRLVKKGLNVLKVDYCIPRHILDVSKSQGFFYNKITPLINQAVIAGNFCLFGNSEIRLPGRTISLGDWTKKGYKFFSGTGIYSGDFFYRPDRPGRKIFIEIECFHDCAEIFINTKRTGLLFCEPYRSEITPFLREGINKVEIRVTNTVSNLISEAVPSGLEFVRFLYGVTG